MKAITAMALVSALLSLAAILGLSAITISPRTGAHNFQATAMVLAGLFFVGWLSVAFWARARQRTQADATPPPWLRGFLLVASALYSLGIIVAVLG